MANRLEAPGIEDNTEQKHNGLDGNVTERKTITNIYYDCLERIFDFLDPESLLNIAQTCKRLQVAAAAKFGKDFGDCNIILWPFRGYGSPRISTNAKPHTKKGPFYVCGWKFRFPFIRCFGTKIKYLFSNFLGDMNSELTQSQIDNLLRYINRYCADSLNHLSIRANKESFPFENFSKPFEKVSNLDIWVFKLGSSLSEIAKFFPNLRVLEIRSDNIDRANIAVCFPHLKRLSLHIRNDFVDEIVTSLVYANPQLHSLDLNNEPANWRIDHIHHDK